MSVNVHCTSSIWVTLRHTSYLYASLSTVLYQLQSLQPSVGPSVALAHGRTHQHVCLLRYHFGAHSAVHKLLQHEHTVRVYVLYSSLTVDSYCFHRQP